MYSLHTKLISQQEDSRNLQDEQRWENVSRVFQKQLRSLLRTLSTPEEKTTTHPTNNLRVFETSERTRFMRSYTPRLTFQTGNCESSRDPSASPRGRQVTAPPTQAPPNFLHILSLSADNKVSSTFLSAFLLQSCFSRCLAQPPVLNARPKTVREVCNNIYMHTYGQSAQSCLCLTTDGKTNNVSSSCPVYFETRLSFFGFRVIYSDW